MLGNQIVELLMWENTPPIMTSLPSMYAQAVQIMLDDLIYKDTLSGGDIAPLISQLPHNYDAFSLVMPDMKISLFESVTKNDYKAVAQLCLDYVNRELFISGKTKAAPTTGYTLSGKHYIHEDKRIEDGFDVLGIALLFEPDDVERRKLITDEYKQLAYTRMTNALWILFNTSPVIEKLFGSIIHSITLKQDPDGGTECSSFYRRPGDIAMTNFEFFDDDITLAEHLLHEMIHSLLYTFEHTFYPISLRDRDGRNSLGEYGYIETHSPWSGNFIGDVSLGHALFVYFGLTVFFEKLLFKDNGQNTALFKEKMLYNAYGFLNMPDVSRYFINLEKMNLWSVNAMLKMQSIVKEKVRYDTLLAV